MLNKMDTGPILRATREETLRQILGEVAEDPTLTGLHAYLTVMHEYLRTFVPGCQEPVDIVASLSFVTFFFRIWSGWLRSGAVGVTATVNGPPSEFFTDIEISIGCIINLLSFVHDSGGDMETLCLEKLGSDCVELIWGMLGSWKSNQRCYTMGDAMLKVKYFGTMNVIVRKCFATVAPSCP
jgi:hypothetical protein